ncbi:hypothetical protein P154DRAFT_579384 [Amniculicola lignicola CBS 123094]|uniref:Uncharacterized protein n=1 Tax=Amniculicola lignicola CBS 123094 TaxID=1392246 RepID=A0A6A5WD46_9PLEO|nr:hypothetical protein P154DRAFT_579384 [Amniculicola lignicola CBS 123094]
MAICVSAASLPPRTEQSSLETNLTAMGELCGSASYKGSSSMTGLFKNGNLPYGLVGTVNYVTIWNQNCGICSFYNDHVCNPAKLVWFAGPAPRKQIPDATCYICLDVLSSAEDAPVQVEVERAALPSPDDEVKMDPADKRDAIPDELDSGDANKDAAVYCGHAWWDNGSAKPINKNGRCAAFDTPFKYATVENQDCSKCSFWENRDCQGSPQYSGGYGQHTLPNRGSVSYHCI